MKKISIILSIIIAFTILVACNKQSEGINNANKKIEPVSISAPLMQDAGIYVDIGVWMFGDCNLDYRCGPCPGICIRRGRRPRLEMQYSAEFQDGEQGAFRIKSIDKIRNEISIDFLTDNIAYGDKTGLEGDFELGNEIASKYGYSNLTLKAGTYPVSIETNPNGTAIFKCTIIE